VSRTVAELHGRVADGFECVADELRATVDGPGAAFAATVDGELVVDVWSGTADDTGTPWNEDTIILVFSGTKGLVAVCLLLLADRGLLDLDAPVIRYWPEFAAHGKEGVLVRHVVSHEAGLPGLLPPVTAGDLLNGDRMAARLAGATPFWKPGTRLAYHALTFGWLCAELIRRIDGRSLGIFFAEEVAETLGLDLWIGLPPALEDRVAMLRRADDFGITFLGDKPDPLLAALYGPMLDTFVWNEETYHQAEIPAANGIGTVRSIARLYGCLARGGELDGRRLLSPEIVVLGRRELSRDLCAVTRRPYAFGAGFELQTELLTLGPLADAFGHTGSGGSRHGAWPAARVGFSYATSELRGEERDDRGRRILAALADAVSRR
jgi:CubicO group peptidase (beta-lactamase class C family)